MKNSVSILLAMKKVALEANKCLHALWPVASYCDEQRCVPVAVTELYQVCEGRRLFYLVRED